MSHANPDLEVSAKIFRPGMKVEALRPVGGLNNWMFGSLQNGTMG